MSTNSQVYEILSSPSPSDNVDAASDNDDNLGCTCPNQLCHWDKAGEVHPNLPNRCKISVQLERGDGEHDIATAATVGSLVQSPAHVGDEGSTGQKEPSSGPTRRSNRLQARQRATNPLGSGSSSTTHDNAGRSAKGNSASSSRRAAVQQASAIPSTKENIKLLNGAPVQPAPVVGPAPVVVAVPAPAAPIVAAAPAAPIVAATPATPIVAAAPAIPIVAAAPAPAVVHDIFNPDNYNAAPPPYNNPPPNPIFAADNDIAWYHQALAEANVLMQEEPADAPNFPAAEEPVPEEDSVVQKTDYTVTDRAEKRKFGNTTHTTYLKEVKKTSLFIRTKPYPGTRLDITCNFNQ